jgi:hypothetical protein
LNVATNASSARLEKPAHEPVHGGPRVHDGLAAHAVARVEQHPETHRQALVGELRDRLGVAVLEDLEIVLHEPFDQPALRVRDGHRDEHRLDTAPELRLNRLGPDDARHERRRQAGPKVRPRWPPRHSSPAANGR